MHISLKRHHKIAMPPELFRSPNVSAMTLCIADGTSSLSREALESSWDTARADGDGERASPGQLHPAILGQSAGSVDKPG